MNHRRTSLIVTAGLLPTCGLIVAGCSSGSGQGSFTGGGTQSQTTVAGVSTGDVLRDPQGYDWGQAAVSSDVSVSVHALGVSPLGTQAVAALAPQPLLVELEGGAEEALPFPGQQFLASGGEHYLATGGAPGAGDVYLRTPTGWREALAGDQDALVLAEHTGRVLAFSGAVGGQASAYRLDASAGTWERLAELGDYVPSAAATVFGEVWLGAGPATASGAASLRRGGWMGLAEVTLNGLSDLPGQRQEVTALQAVPRGVVVALGSFDAASGEPLGGEVVLVVPGEAERLLGDYTGEAPLALAFQDETLYVGTSSGRLQFLDGQGRMIDEPLPATVDAVEALAAPDRTTLLVGCRSSQGALLFTRAARSLTATTPAGGATGTAGPGWAQARTAMLACAACHSTMQTGWTVSAGLSDDQGDYQATLAQVDLTTPVASALLEKGSGAVAHAGGALWGGGSADYQTVLTWIEGGAPFDAPPGAVAGTPATTTPGATPGAATPPANTSNPDYVNDMQVLLGSCVGCHASMNTGYSLSASLGNAMADFQATLGEVDLGNPAGSLLLTKTNGTVGHAGGAGWPVGSAAYQTALAWIQGGAPFQIAGRTPATPTIPAKPVYVTDIKPIAASCVVCHDGTRTDDMRLSRGLVDDARDYRSLLGEVNLGDPARSSVLREPSRGGEHPKIFDVGSLPYQTLLKWIETGAAFN